MQDFTKKLVDIVENMDQKTMGEIKLFAATLELQKQKTISALRDEIRVIEQATQKFLQQATQLKMKNIGGTAIRTVGNVTFSCPLITDAYEANHYPYKPCCISSVPDWYFIAFPHLKQILPVTHVTEPLLGKFTGSEFTKLDENQFTKKFYDSLHNTKFAVVPFTANCWKKLMLIDKSKWSLVLHQMRICYRRDLLPISTTTFLAEKI
jgi:hypothetical protein